MSGMGERCGPASAEASPGLGAAELASRRPGRALEGLERAARLAPADPEAHARLGLAQKQSGLLAEAVASYERALELEPRNAGVWVNLARVLRELGRLEAAITAFARALEIEPCAPIASMASNALREAGRHEEALRAARTALQHDPRFAEAHLNEGAALHVARQAEAAVFGYVAALALPATREHARANLRLLLARAAGDDGSALALARTLLTSPADPRALLAIARLARQQGRPAAALVCYEAALELTPSVDAEHERASLLWDLGFHEQAERVMAAALERYPSHLALYRLFGAWFASGERRPTQSCEHLLERCPDDAVALAKLGGVLQRLGLPARALGLYDRLIALQPRIAQGHFYVGTVLTEQGLHREACAAFERALALDPERWDIRSSLLFCAHLDPAASPEALRDEHRRFGAQLEKSLGPSVRRAPRRSPSRVRVGYVSPDFCAHPISYYIEPVLREHARDQFEVVCYSDVKHPDAVTARLARWAELVAVRGWSHERLHERIVSDAIDILVDLTGHTANNRLPVFGRAPSPVQATWLGYFDTTGLEVMDYRIADAWSVPPAADALWVERVLRLPRSANCYQPPDAPAPAPPPCLARGHVTFGCFNNPAKLGEGACRTFARILRAVPGSELLFKYRAWSDPAVRRRHLSIFASEGVSAERIRFEGSSALAEFLQSFARIDIALDPFPYSGETTALHTLWMGVPLVSLEGPTLVQRLGSRVLRVAGLHDWVVSSVPSYIATAAALAGDRLGLARARSELRERLAASPLLDHAGVTRELEAAYRQMLQERTQ
jgi:predicted O-linked N-acetylglucosamine transferase (SPINDLY family)